MDANNNVGYDWCIFGTSTADFPFLSEIAMILL